MSTQILTSTTFISIDIAINRKARFMNKVQENVSGKETRVALRTVPRWTWDVQFNFLRSTSQAQVGSSAVAGQEFNNFASFYNSLSGGFDSFLWLDPEDNNDVLSSASLVSTANLAIYQLTRTLDGQFDENVFAPNVVSQVFLVGSSISSGSTVGVTTGLWGSSIPGQITLSTFTPASSNVVPYATFSYYWPVRWDQDELQFGRFGLGWWEVKKMSFTSII